MQPLAVRSKDIASAGHQKSVSVKVGQCGLVAAVRKGNGSEGAIAQKEMEQTAIGVHHHVDHAVFVFKIIDIDDVGGVGSAEEKELVVRSDVKHASFGIRNR